MRNLMTHEVARVNGGLLNNDDESQNNFGVGPSAVALDPWAGTPEGRAPSAPGYTGNPDLPIQTITGVTPAGTLFNAFWTEFKGDVKGFINHYGNTAAQMLGLKP